MPTLTPLERRSLRAKAHHLNPVVAIGVHGLTAAVLREIDVALNAHELIKIRVAGGERNERETLLDTICSELACAPVQHLGKLLIVWRRNPDLRSDETDAKSPGKATKRLAKKTTREPRREPSQPHRRVATPSGTSHAPSQRRRRAENSAESDLRTNEQSRRRRRAR